ncbi:hypothetical protein NE237_028233 [Protea cynaroides]|uniref:Uncharacterized protein n=1 Tax=Protea cynaroides TaxID=273540 RepID=A0A9Q0GQT1_9MAGN|nr:hypothetical protein NE237_028233 [Protea cynaroides]
MNEYSWRDSISQLLSKGPTVINQCALSAPLYKSSVGPVPRTTTIAIKVLANEESREGLYRVLLERFRDLEVSDAKLKEQFQVLLQETQDEKTRKRRGEGSSPSSLDFTGWSDLPSFFLSKTPYRNVLESMRHAVHVCRILTGEIIYWPQKSSHLDMEKIVVVLVRILGMWQKMVQIIYQWAVYYPHHFRICNSFRSLLCWVDNKNIEPPKRNSVDAVKSVCSNGHGAAGSSTTDKKSCCDFLVGVLQVSWEVQNWYSIASIRLEGRGKKQIQPDAVYWGRLGKALHLGINPPCADTGKALRESVGKLLQTLHRNNLSLDMRCHLRMALDVVRMISGPVKVGDFGLSKLKNAMFLTEKSGRGTVKIFLFSPFFLAPVDGT